MYLLLVWPGNVNFTSTLWARQGETKMFSGSLVALITPFQNGVIDETGFQSFVEWQISEGTNGLIPTGTTGTCGRGAIWGRDRSKGEGRVQSHYPSL